MLRQGEVHVWRARRGVALGEILARYLGRVPGRFEKGPHGKPRLAGENGWLRFNLSHSGDVTLIAVARDVEVGVDVERIRPVIEMHAIARRWLGRDDIADEREFFRAWTRHEAMVKALGVGLSGAAESFDGFVAEIDAGPGYAAAAAVLAPNKMRQPGMAPFSKKGPYQADAFYFQVLPWGACSNSQPCPSCF